MTRALVTRPADDAEPLAEALRARDIVPLIDPMLRIEAIAEAPVALDGVQAVLFTSTNGVRAFARAETRRDLPAYAVGDSTASAARQAGFADVKSAAGDSAALARLVIDECDPDKGALLHARGADVAGDLADTLEAAEFELRTAELYRAVPADALGDETRRALAEGTLDIALFYSPRTAQIFAGLVRDAQLGDALSPVTAICLSPAVADALAGLDWKSVAVADRPTQGALLAALDSNIPARAETDMEDQPADAAPPPPAAPRPSRAPVAIAVIAVVIALAGAAAGTFPLWREAAGLGPDTRTAAPRIDRLESDLAALKSQLAAQMTNLAKRQDEIGSKTDANAKARDALDAKLAALDDRVSKLSQGAGDAAAAKARVDALDQKVNALASQVGAVAGQGGQIAPLADAVKALSARVAAVETAASAQRSGMQEAAGLVVATAQLSEAVRTGAPYATPLATVAALAKDDMDVQHQVAMLLPRARTGVATDAALAARFPKVADEVARAAIAPEGAGWTDRVLARLASLFMVRRTDADATGDSPQAIVARAEADMKAGDLAGAVDEVTKLTGKPAEAAAAWLGDARARRDALRAAKAMSDLAMQSYLHPASGPAPATGPAAKPAQ